ncbi:hypothetical protein ACLEXA_02285 [Pseudescherichia vulneris]
MNRLSANRFFFLLILSSLPFSTLHASSPKGGVFNFAEIDNSGGSTDPLDMPLALPIANFFGYTRDGNKYSYTAKNSLPIAINIMYIESSLGHIPDSQLPPITDDNYDFSEHYMHYDADERYSWVSGGREGDWSLPIINAKAHVPGDAVPVITACSGSYETPKESRYKCRPASTTSTQELSGYNNLINFAASKNKPLWVGSIVFPAASDGPEGNTSNVAIGGEGHEMVIYLPHRRMSLIHFEAILLGDAKGSDRRLAAWTLKSDDGEHFIPYLDSYDDVMGPAFVSVGKDTLNNRTLEPLYLIPYYMNDSVRIIDIAAIHTRLVGGVEWPGIWSDHAPVASGLGIEGSNIFMCFNGEKGSVDDYTDLEHFQEPSITGISPDRNSNIFVPEGQKGFTLAQFLAAMSYPPATEDNAYICDTKGTQLFSNRIEYYPTGPTVNDFSDFMVLEKNITLKQ